MGRITEKLRRGFNNALRQKVIPHAAILKGQKTAQELPDVEKLIQEGTHPAHAVYSHVINLLSVFLEEVARLPFMRSAHKFLTRAEDIYMPGYPPMSPITVSHYASWTACDVRFGEDQETLCDCFLGVSDLLDLDPIRLEAAQHLSQSRLGLYEMGRQIGDRFQLRELVSGTEVEALIPTGFKARPGTLFLARLLPPLLGVPGPHIALTTPYVLAGYARRDWLKYFMRQQIFPGTVGVEERLHRHMKHGNDGWYWSEFLFYGYVNFRSDAIFLTGFPDLPETQPQHKSFDRSTFQLNVIAQALQP